MAAAAPHRHIARLLACVARQPHLALIIGAPHVY